MNNQASLKITLEISQETNLDELMAHLYLMQDNIPANPVEIEDDLMVDFSIHEGELAPVEPEFLTNTP